MCSWMPARLELTILSGSVTVFMNTGRPRAPRSRKASIMSPNSRHKKEPVGLSVLLYSTNTLTFPKLKVAEHKQHETDILKPQI